MFVLCLLVSAMLQAPADQPKPAAAPAAPLQPAPGNPVVVVSTTLGDITVELFRDKAPVSVENFLQYAREGFYEGTIFHRIERHFVVQGGGYTPDLVEKPTRPPIQNEATNGLRNLRGTVAMARRQPLRSATSQFYFNLSDNATLDHRGFSPPEFGYAVFGRVLSGMDVVDKIGTSATKTVDDFEGVPVEPVVITRVTIRP
ncbi:MAG TPA: peptidylprolyl isomerase [Vicinamibacterales bacterium]|nr:peptidylprolyl isomerase [Vicinamibacterales bacterium]